MNEDTCKRDVWESAWRHHRCTRKATTDAGFCRQHDPDARRRRLEAKPPTKFERKILVRKRLDEWLDANLDPATSKAVQNMISDAWAEWVTPTWPLQDYFANVEAKPDGK